MKVEDEEDTEEADEGVAGGGELWSDDETLARLRLCRLEETLEPLELLIARGMWLAGWGWCSPLRSPPVRDSEPPALWVKDSAEEETASSCRL